MAKKDQGDVRRHMDHSSRRQASTERSPLHPQARNHINNNNNGSNRSSTGSPARIEGINNFAPSTPGRSRMRGSTTTTQEDQSEKGQGPPLPKFGAWDPKDPSSADGFTIIFNKARDEKRAGAGGRPQSPVKNNDNGLYKNPDRSSSNKKWYCCFGTAET